MRVAEPADEAAPESRVRARRRACRCADDKGPLARPPGDEPFALELAVRLQHGVGVDRELADDLANRWELVVRLAPQPSVPDVIRKLPARAAGLPLAEAAAAARTVSAVPIRPEAHRPKVAPLSADTFKIEFTGSREIHDKLRQAQDLLRHRVPGGHLAVVFEKALDALIANLMKERFGVGRKPRRDEFLEATVGASLHIPIAIKRAVYLRDEGQCAFLAEDGRRCCERGGLEFDHIDGFAQTRVHDANRIRLVCRAHNQHTADQLNGRVFMERLREARKADKDARRAVASAHIASDVPTRPERMEQQDLFLVLD